MTQLEKLDNLIRAAERCRVAAEHNLIFASRSGVALLNAMHDLTEVDGLYDLEQEARRECGMDCEQAA